MNKAFEMILKRLDKPQFDIGCIACTNKEKCDEVQENINDEKTDLCAETMRYIAKEIVQKVAKEYNGGWIPCSERLPEDDSICIVTVEYPNNETVVDYGWFDRKSVCWFVGTQEFRTSNVLAWMSLPQPYKESENKK